MKYNAFISYSHSGESEIAQLLDRSLRSLAKPWFRTRALSVFRDASVLSANPALWGSISDALTNSDYLVVCCSPDAASSPWVGREIQHWLANRPADHILLVLAAGELKWSDELQAFDMGVSTALPPALANAFSEEPLFVDMRWVEAEERISIRDPRLKNQFAEVAAPMHGVSKDVLVGEDVRQHRRVVQLIGLAGIVLLALSILAGAEAWNASRNAHRADNNARKATSELHRIISKDHTLNKLNRQIANAQATIFDENALATIETDQATKELGVANTETSKASQAQLQASQAQFQASQASEAASAARGQASKAATQALQAEASRSAALLSARQADLQAADAESQEKVSEKAASDARAQAATAQQAVASAQAHATQLQADDQVNELIGNSALTAPGRLDLSLLLANAATQVQAASAQVATTAHDNLSAALSGASQQVKGFLNFPASQGPLTLSKVAISPDGKFVAAADDSVDIETGTPKAQLFIWQGSDPTKARAVQLASNLYCISDLQWDAVDQLITTEQLKGCSPTPTALSMTELCAGSTQPYLPSRVTIWDMNSRQGLDPSVYIGQPAIAYPETSPVSLSRDGKKLIITYSAGFCDSKFNPSIGNFRRKCGDWASKFLYARPTGFGLPVPNFSQSGRYLLGLDESAQTAAIWDLETFEGQEQCSANVLSSGGCFREVTPSAPGGTSNYVEMSSDDSYFATTTDGQAAVAVFSAQNGDPASQPISVGGIVTGLAIESNAIAITSTGGPGNEGTIVDNWLSSAPTAVQAGSTTSDCDLIPSFSMSGNLVFMSTICSAVGQQTTDVFTEQGILRGTTHGQIQSSSADDTRIVSQVEQRTIAGSGVTSQFQVWDFSQPTPKLVGDATNEVAVVSPDGLVVAGYHAYDPVDTTPGSVQLWIDNTEEVLPGSLGMLAFDFESSGIMVGVGTTGAGVQWDVNGSYRLLYSDSETKCPSGTDALDSLLRSTLSPDGSIRAISHDGKTIELESLSNGAIVGQR